MTKSYFERREFCLICGAPLQDGERAYCSRECEEEALYHQRRAGLLPDGSRAPAAVRGSTTIGSIVATLVGVVLILVGLLLGVTVIGLPLALPFLIGGGLVLWAASGSRRAREMRELRRAIESQNRRS